MTPARPIHAYTYTKNTSTIRAFSQPERRFGKQANYAQHLYNIMDTSAYLTALSILVNIAGFYFIVKQIKQQALATRGETYTSMCGLSYDILNMIFANQFLYDYIYKNKRLHATTENRIQVLICCEMIANYCDNIALQRENIPDHIWERWRNFIKEQISLSYELYNFMHEYKSWYSPEIIAILNEVKHS